MTMEDRIWHPGHEFDTCGLLGGLLETTQTHFISSKAPSFSVSLKDKNPSQSYTKMIHDVLITLIGCE